MFSKDEVEELIDYLASAIKTQISGEVGTVMNMGALAIDQLLEDAQTKNVELDLETSELENQGLIEAIDRMSLDAMPRSAKKNTKLVNHTIHTLMLSLSHLFSLFPISPSSIFLSSLSDFFPGRSKDNAG